MKIVEQKHRDPTKWQMPTANMHAPAKFQETDFLCPLFIIQSGLLLTVLEFVSIAIFPVIKFNFLIDTDTHLFVVRYRQIVFVLVLQQTQQMLTGPYLGIGLMGYSPGRQLIRGAPDNKKIYSRI